LVWICLSKDCGYSGYGVGGFGVVVIINILLFCILLSPACASFDMFDDFEQRGNVFKDIVK
jgi:hypothetical protein